MNEYSHLDVQPTDKQVEATIEDQDIYADIGELDANDLMQFAYQISTGMVRSNSSNNNNSRVIITIVVVVVDCFIIRILTIIKVEFFS